MVECDNILVMNKTLLITKILKHLRFELANCELAATNAHLAATDDQSVAETQYDTLAIESAYLAEGQSRRLVEFKAAIQALEQLSQQFNLQHTTDIALTDKITLGSLVQLATEVEHQQWFFIAPSAGGYRTTIDGQHYTVVTPQSPMGNALIGKQIDDDIEVLLGNSKLIDDIVVVI